MTAYQLKSDPSVIVKAVQFNPHEHPWPDGVISWDGKPRPRDMSWGYVELPQKREHVFTGDYIVLDRLGNPYPVRSNLFEDAYRPVIVLGLGDHERLVRSNMAPEELAKLIFEISQRLSYDGAIAKAIIWEQVPGPVREFKIAVAAELLSKYSVLPTETKKDDFWTKLSLSMTINERRELFSKLAEHLGIGIDEHGVAEQGEKKYWTLEEAKAVLEPYRRI